MAVATIDGVTDYQLASGDEVQVLLHQGQVLVGATHDDDAAMAALTLAEAATLASRLAELVKAGS